MKRIITWIIVIIILGAVGFFYITRPVAAPSEDIATATQSDQLSNASESTQVEGMQNNASTLYRISQDDSKAEFSISETLRGSPFTAVGVTNQIAGDIIISSDAQGTPTIKLGTVKIDARTFKTDSSQRDGAIDRMILKAENSGNEYIIFTPSSIIGLPAAIADGQEFSFTVNGTLRISGVTKPVILTVKATKTPDTFSGTVSTTLKRSDFDLRIPNIPFVANVSDSFSVSSAFTARMVQS